MFEAGTPGLVAELTNNVGEMLVGYPPAAQGATPACLLATWRAGHLIPGDAEATEALRGVG